MGFSKPTLKPLPNPSQTILTDGDFWRPMQYLQIQHSSSALHVCPPTRYISRGCASNVRESYVGFFATQGCFRIRITESFPGGAGGLTALAAHTNIPAQLPFRSSLPRVGKGGYRTLLCTRENAGSLTGC